MTERTVIETTGGEFYVDGLQVRKSSIVKKYSDGTEGHSLGFIVCECSEYVDGAAQEIAEALNFMEKKNAEHHQSARKRSPLELVPTADHGR